MFEKQKNAIFQAFKFWRATAVFMLAVSIVTTVCGGLAVNNIQRAAEQSAAEYQAKLESVEHVRDMAVEQLGSMVQKVEILEEELNALKSVQAQAQSNNMVGGQYISLGEFTLTAYCSCEKCCGKWADGITASGETVEPGMIAVDPKIIPLGSYVMIDGVEYLAADTGGTIKGNRIDVFSPSHTSALEYGIQRHEVYLLAEEEG